MSSDWVLTLVVVPVVYPLEVKDSSVIEVLTREDDVVQVARVGVCNGVACPHMVSPRHQD
jgi:hypothetical protein